MLEIYYIFDCFEMVYNLNKWNFDYDLEKDLEHHF